MCTLPNYYYYYYHHHHHHHTAALSSVYLGPTVTAIFRIPYSSVRLLLAQKKCEQHTILLAARTYPLINDDDDDDDDTIFY